jgi:uracil phosphoribosyltransferase
MAADIQHQKFSFESSHITHSYGENVFIFHSPMMLSYLAKLGSPQTKQPEINVLTEILYQYLFDKVVDLFFPKSTLCMETRMINSHPEATFEGLMIHPETPVVTVDLARAGTVPSNVCYNRLNYLLNPDRVRQDHFYISRKTNVAGEVTGVDVAGSKIGGSVDQSIVLFPDPMGATGSTIVEAYNHYVNNVGGNPKALVAMHLIITPEYLKKVTKLCPHLKIVSLRLDRGLSSLDVLNQAPGLSWKNERGLNDHQYIVPGAGGLGEVLNNSYC